MIKIIKPEKMQVAKCPKCECEFSFKNEDIGGFEYKPVDHIEHIDLTDNESMFPRIGEDMYAHFTRVKTGTTKLGWVAITEMIWNSNSLYFKFPKKGRRKLRRHYRCRRISLIRIKKWRKNNGR